MEACGWVVGARVNWTTDVELVAIRIALRPQKLHRLVRRDHKGRDVRPAPCSEGEVRTWRSAEHRKRCRPEDRPGRVDRRPYHSRPRRVAPRLVRGQAAKCAQ